MSELGDDASRKPRERRRPIGKGRKRRAADARHVKRDGRRIGDRMKKRFGELPIRANTIEQKQGRPPSGPRVVATQSGWRPTAIVRTSMPSSPARSFTAAGSTEPTQCACPAPYSKTYVPGAGTSAQ